MRADARRAASGRRRRRPRAARCLRRRRCLRRTGTSGTPRVARPANEPRDLLGGRRARRWRPGDARRGGRRAPPCDAGARGRASRPRGRPRPTLRAAGPGARASARRARSAMRALILPGSRRRPTSASCASWPTNHACSESAPDAQEQYGRVALHTSSAQCAPRPRTSSAPIFASGTTFGRHVGIPGSSKSRTRASGAATRRKPAGVLAAESTRHASSCATGPRGSDVAARAAARASGASIVARDVARSGVEGGDLHGRRTARGTPASRRAGSRPRACRSSGRRRPCVRRRRRRRTPRPTGPRPPRRGPCPRRSGRPATRRPRAPPRPARRATGPSAPTPMVPPSAVSGASPRICVTSRARERSSASVAVVAGGGLDLARWPDRRCRGPRARPR